MDWIYRPVKVSQHWRRVVVGSNLFCSLKVKKTIGDPLALEPDGSVNKLKRRSDGIASLSDGVTLAKRPYQARHIFS